MSAITAILLIVVVLALGGIAFLMFERYRTRTLKARFGPEYDRALGQEGNAYRANAALEKRQQRVEKYHLRRLSPEERDRFAGEWRRIQERFVDNPRDAVASADQLVCQAMHARGYPTSDFERQAADLSVDHPRVLKDYRVAHEIALRSDADQASTEDMRLAMQHYRNLFEEIAGVGPVREEVYH